MAVVIRRGFKSDLPDVMRLVRELAVFEKSPDAVMNTVEQMERDGFGIERLFGLFVAEENNFICGMALYFTKYSTWKGKGIYLDDLIVTESHRRRGIGKMLLDRVISHARESGAKQLHWQVLDWNTPAIEFYRKLNVSIESEWLDCKMSEEQISSYEL